MKKIFRTTYLALLLIACLSCNNDPMPDAPKGKYPILFRCSDETRAVATVDSMKVDGNGFDVYAYFKTTTGANESFAKNVIWNDSEGMWLYEGIEYWIPGATYWFKAVYPHGIATVDNSNSTQAVTITGYEISNQYDILVAETDREGLEATLEDQAPTTGSVVSLQFQHLLANVTIKIKAEINVTINDVSLKFVPVKGSYTNGIWSYTTQGNIEKISLNKELNSSNKEFQDVTDGGFLVFPNSTDGAKLYVRTSDKSYDLELPATLNEWVAGTKYTYTLTIKQNDIHFDEPTVEEWDEENATGSVVIK